MEDETKTNNVEAAEAQPAEQKNTDKGSCEKKCPLRKIGAAIKANKKKVIVISIIAFVLICAIIAVSCLSAFLFNRFSEGFVPTDDELAAAKGQYKRVVIIGVDGVGDYFSHVYTPYFDKLFDTEKNASVTYTGVSIYPTISCENWMSMFHGVRPVYHGFIFRDTNQRVEAGNQTDTEKYPSFMKQYLDQNPNGKIYSSCTWRGVNNGVIENDKRIMKVNSDAEQIYQFLNDEKVWSRVTDTECQQNYKLNEKGEKVLEKNESNKIEEINAFVEAPIVDATGQLREFLEAEVLLNGYGDETIAMRDAITMQRVIEANVNIYYDEEGVHYEAKNDYAISYMHLDQVDHAGHNYGYSKPGYSHAVSRVDNLIGWLYDAFDKAGMLDDTLFVLCTDHGHRYPGGHKNHGKNTEEEVNVTFAVAGKTIKAGTPGKYVNTDMPAIISYALGVKASENWQGRVPHDMFK